MSSSTSAGQLSRKLATLLVQVPNLSSAAQARLASSFQTVHYATGGKGLTKEVLDETDWSFTTNKGLEGVEKFEETKELKVVQLCSSGADKAIASPSFSHQAASSPPAANPVTLCTASGIHVLSIPNYIVTTWLSLYHRLPAQILVARNDRRWGTREEFGGKEGYYAKGTRGKTVGFLGYGHLARDTARLMVPFGVEIIAANSDGQRKKDYGFVYPGTGDIDASLPSQMYSTSDPEQLKAFLERTDILVASLPSTLSTKGLLTRERLGYLPKEAVLINVGRGDLFQSDDLLHVLDKADGLWGAALDVTQPEPLPNDHPLWSHPKTIITPHLSGDTENEMDLAVDILLENVRRWRAGEDLANVADLQKGY